MKQAPRVFYRRLKEIAATQERKVNDLIMDGMDAVLGKYGHVPVEPELTTSVVIMRMDANLLQRIDAAAKRQGISRTAWLYVAAWDALRPKKRRAT